MTKRSIALSGAAVALALVLQSAPAGAQQAPNGQWFVPGQPHTAAPARQAPRPVNHPPPSAAAPAAVPMASPMGGVPGGMPEDGTPEGAGGLPQMQVQLPPPPEIPPVPKGPATPAAIVGILSVPDVLRVSTAYQAAYKELNARGQKLNEDAQKEQVTLRDLGQSLANERGRLTPEQIRGKEREIQDRATEAQRRFGERNRIIQEAGQYVMLQINRTMEQAAQQVALSRGINLVLNRAQILGTTADFDLTPAVAEVMNKVLSSVVVPPDGVSPLAMASQAPGATPDNTKPANTPMAAATPGKPPQRH